MKKDSLRLRKNEMIFFVDYNNTMVDYENEYDMGLRGNLDDRLANPSSTRFYLIKTLREFEEATGIIPKICIVTNARKQNIDGNGYAGIFNDIKNTFFPVGREKELEKYIKYLVYRENDGYFTINPESDGYLGLFDYFEFSEDVKNIRYVEEFKKLETVSRMMSLLDPELSDGKGVSKYILFAGDSIKDDYPMMKFQTPEGVSKVFVRPRKVQKMSTNMMWKFYSATGGTLTSINPKTNRKFLSVDDSNFGSLSERDQKIIQDYAMGGRVFLTQKNSRGFMDGVRELQKIIVSENGNQKGIL